MYSKVNQLYTYMHPFSDSFPFRLLQNIKQRAIRCLLVVFYFKYSSVYMSTPSGVSHLSHHVSLSISCLKSLLLHAYMLKSMSYLTLVLESGRWVIFPFFCVLIFWNKAKFKNSILRIIQTSSRKFSMDFSAIPQSLLNPEWFGIAFIRNLSFKFL